MSFSVRSQGLAPMILQRITGSSRSLLEQALYPKTEYGRTLGPLAYGALYSGGTYLGFPGNYNKSQRLSNPYEYNLDMPYGYYRRRRYRRYGYGRRYYRNYRRYY